MSSHLTASSPIVASFNPVPSLFSPDPGELSRRLAARVERFFSNVHGSEGNPGYETALPQYPPTQKRRCSTTRVNMDCPSPSQELCTVLHYGKHASAGKEVDSVHHKIADQVQAGHANVSPLSDVHDILKLWLSLVAAIPQVGRFRCLNFNFT